MSILHVAIDFLIQTAIAAGPPVTPCPAILPGCGGPTNILVTSIIPHTVNFMLRLIGALAVVMLVWYGLKLITNLGDESNITKARHAILYALLGIGLSIVSQMIVSFVATEEYGQSGSADLLIAAGASAVRILLNITNIVFALVIVYEGARMVMSQGKTDEFNKARTAVMWAIIGAIFVNLSHALVRIVTGFFGA